MSKILKNNTASPVLIADTGITVPASGQYVIPPQDYLLWAASSNVVTRVGDSTLTINDGSSDLSISNGIDLIKGVFPTTVNTNFPLDVSGQGRVSQQTNLLNFYFSHTDHTLLFFRQTLTGATITWNSTIAAMVLSTTTSNGSSAILRTKKTVPYQVGRAHTIACSCLFGSPVANSSKGFGLMDSNDGLFWAMSGSGLNVNVRSSTSGTPVDTTIARANWNLDKLDGTGPSGFNLDTTKVAIYVIEYTWHGAGRVRFGVKVNKDIIYCHEFDFDNTSAVTYNRLPMDPVRAFVTNSGVTSGANTFHVFSVSATVHNHLQVKSLYHFSASRDIVRVVANNTTKPLIGIRPKALFKSLLNRVTVSPSKILVAAGNEPVFVQVVYNPASVTGAVWTSADNESATEFDVSATAITGGTIINEFYVAANDLYENSVTASVVDIEGLVGRIPLAYSNLGPQFDVLYVTVKSVAGNSDTFGRIAWEEYQ